MIRLVMPILLVFIACGNNNKAIQKAKFDEVMAIHDELMPYMGTIRTLQKDIKVKMNSIDSIGTAGSKLIILSRDLDEANESMMNWMHNFSRPSDKKDHQEIMDYYAKEFNNISAIKKQMLNAIKNGRQNLGQN